MTSQTTISDALIEAGLEAEAARRWARAIEAEQSAPVPQPSAEQQPSPRRRWIDSERLHRFLDRGFPILIGIYVFNFAALFMLLGYVIGRLLEG